jgi:hypothetical protein
MAQTETSILEKKLRKSLFAAITLLLIISFKILENLTKKQMHLYKKCRLILRRHFLFKLFYIKAYFNNFRSLNKQD